jgi:hypothetical protein
MASLVMADRYPPMKQREALLSFRDTLGCRDNALHRDECGDWAVFAKYGRIHAVCGALDRPETPGFQIMVVGEFSTGRWWGAAKRGLSFAAVTNDGDDEGALFMDRLPSAEEAESIRHYLGIAKKRAMSEEALAHLASVRRPFEKRSAVETALDCAGGPSRPLPVSWSQHAPEGAVGPLSTPSPAWVPR